MVKFNLQLFGGRGSGSDSWLGGGGGQTPAKVTDEKDLISQREDGKQSEVDAVLEALRNTNGEYEFVVANVTTAKVSPPNIMAFFDESTGYVTVNEAYFDSGAMDRAYDSCVQDKFHPPRGDKSGIEATVAHELGHALTQAAANKRGVSFEDAAKDIVIGGSKSIKSQSAKVAKAISGYAEKSNAECIAEAYADVYCNGKGAKPESHAIVSALNKVLKGK